MEISDFLEEMEKGFFRRLDKSDLDGAGRKLVKEAVSFAFEAHYGQEPRASGEDFIIHPVAVADLLLGIGRSAKVIAAGVFHDIVEDTKISLAEIEKNFGKEIAFLVDGMTKIFRRYDIKEIKTVFGPQVAFAVRETKGGTAPFVRLDIF